MREGAECEFLLWLTSSEMEALLLSWWSLGMVLVPEMCHFYARCVGRCCLVRLRR
jgi:hypothetical protein